MGKLKVAIVLRRLLSERGITITQLSRSTKVPASTLATWLSGAKPKDPEQVLTVAQALGTTMAQLLFDEPESAAPLDSLILEKILDGYYRVRLERVVLPACKKGDPS